MSLTKKQFQTLISEVVKKIASTEGVSTYIESYPGCFDNTRDRGHFYYSTRDKGHLYYQATPKLQVDLDMFDEIGAIISSHEYDSFICQLILDTEELIGIVKLQRQEFVEYMEKISRL